jgi:Protein of unknown function (DUF2905)
MSNLGDIGRLLLVLGGVLVLLGLAFLLIGRVPFLGRLPGDISFRRGNVQVFFPLVSCLLASVVLTVLLNLVLWLMRRH